MKKIFLVIVVLSIISCNNDGIKEIEQSIVESDESSDETYYGNKISSDSISEYINVIQEVAEIGRTSAKLEGTIIETCAKKGCWMRVVSEADTLMVRFKDYGFFVPKEGVEGKSTIIEGEIFFDTLTVAQLQHYAEDAGKTEQEIDAIIDSELTLSFLAEGVIIQ